MLIKEIIGRKIPSDLLLCQLASIRRLYSVILCTDTLRRITHQGQGDASWLTKIKVGIFKSGGGVVVVVVDKIIELMGCIQMGVSRCQGSYLHLYKCARIHKFLNQEVLAPQMSVYVTLRSKTFNIITYELIVLILLTQFSHIESFA